MPEEEFSSHDRDLVVMFMTYKISPLRFFKSSSGNKTIFVFLKKAVSEFLECWQLGKPLPVVDIRDVFAAERSFNSCVHDESRGRA